MKIFITEGPPFAGKTVTTALTFKKLPGKKYWIVNDDGDGTGENIDAGVFLGIEGLELAAMTGGCIGCKDPEQTKEVIRKIVADGTFDWLFIEPIGYALGNETPDILHALGVHATVVCFVDVENFAENLEDGFMPPQIKAASLIALTKYGIASSVDDPALDEVTDFIGEHNSEARIFLLPKGSGLPEWVLNHHSHPCGHSHGHNNTSCGHDHHHDHDHSHSEDRHDEDEAEHGQFRLTRPLRPEATYPQVQQIANSDPQIYRAKGRVEGKSFSMGRGTWDPDRLPDDRRPSVTFYSHQPISPDDLMAVAIPAEDAYAGKDIKQILRTSTTSVEGTVLAIRRRLEKFPAAAMVNRFGELVTHPEILSITKELSRRPGVPHEVFAEVICACTIYWLSAAECLRSKNWDNHPSFNEWRRALGTSLGYYGYYHAVDLGDALTGRVVFARPAHLLFAGLREIARLNSYFAKAKLQAEEARDIAKFGLTNEGMTKEEILLVMSHCLALARSEGRHDLAIEWHNAIAEVERCDI